MKCLSIIVFVFSPSVLYSQPVADDIVEYYNSKNVKAIRILWDDYRQSVEHSLAYVMQETIGKAGVPYVFNLHQIKTRLTKAYYQKQDEAQIILKNLDLTQLPYAWLPDAVLSLASNVLKIESVLTKIIINAEYQVMRNNSHVIENVAGQDPYKNTPFLYKQVMNMGHLTFTLDDCMLSGYIIARLKGGSVNLGHEHLIMTKCQYTVELYNKGMGQPPVIAPFSPDWDPTHLVIEKYLLMILRDEFITKLQGALFSYVNTSSIFGHNLAAYEEEQEKIFLKTAENMTGFVRDLNKRILDFNGGIFVIPDKEFKFNHWDESIGNAYGNYASVTLSNMVITGLGTAYNAFTGGPYKLDSEMIGEQIRFSKIQVRGSLSYSPLAIHTYQFSVEISDFAMNIEIKVRDNDRFQVYIVGYRDIQFSLPGLTPGPIQILVIGFNLMQGWDIKAYQLKPQPFKSIKPDIKFSLPGLTPGPIQILVIGYLKNEVSKAVLSTIRAVGGDHISIPGDNNGNVDNLHGAGSGSDCSGGSSSSGSSRESGCCDGNGGSSASSGSDCSGGSGGSGSSYGGGLDSKRRGNSLRKSGGKRSPYKHVIHNEVNK